MKKTLVVTSEKLSKNIGGKQALKTMLVLIVIFEIFLMIVETRGDFANNILFYLDDHLNFLVISFYAVLLALTYWFGRRAGKEIIVLKKNIHAIALKYAMITSIVLIFFLFILIYPTDSPQLNKLKLMAAPSIIIIALVIISWIWSARQIKVKGIVK